MATIYYFLFTFLPSLSAFHRPIQHIDLPTYYGNVRQVHGSKGDRPKQDRGRAFWEICQHAFIWRTARPLLTSTTLSFSNSQKSQRLTKDQCEAQWNEALDQLTVSDHNGLHWKLFSWRSSGRTRLIQMVRTCSGPKFRGSTDWTKEHRMLRQLLMHFGASMFGKNMSGG